MPINHSPKTRSQHSNNKQFENMPQTSVINTNENENFMIQTIIAKMESLLDKKINTLNTEFKSKFENLASKDDFNQKK